MLQEQGAKTNVIKQGHRGSAEHPDCSYLLYITYLGGVK